MEKKKTQQIPYIQWLRVFAITAVVLAHTVANRWVSISHTLPEWKILTWWDTLFRWPVLIFIMITGALFLPRKTSMRQVLTRYVPRMAVCFLLWSTIYNLYAGELTLQTLVSGYFHLWYLPYLCGVYLMLPFLQKIAEDDRLADQLMVIGFIISIAVPWVANLGAFLLPESTPVLRQLEAMLNYTFFFDHVPTLLLGHRLHKTELSPKQRRILYILGLLCVILAGSGTVWASNRANIQNTVFFDFGTPHIVCTAAALFVFAKYNLHKLPRLVQWLAGLSFGIYLIHAMVIELLADRGIHVLTCNPVWFVPVLTAAIIAISAVAAFLLSKLPVIGKYLV